MVSPKRSVKNKEIKKAKCSKYLFRVYIAGQTTNCVDALHNLKRICDEHIPGCYKIEIIDLMKFPQLAKEDNIIVVPMVVRKDPKPVYKVIGNLSNAAEVLIGLDIH